MEARQLDVHWYTFWTQIIAIALVILLAILWFAGLGPAATPCCQPASGAVAALATPSPLMSAASAPASAPTASASAEAFHFTVSAAQGLQVAGATAAVGWWDQRDKLDALLKQGDHIEISGDASQVSLRGNVDSAEAKAQLGASLQALLGPQVTLDNQLQVVAAAPSPASSTPAAAPSNPESSPATVATATLLPVVEVYFAVGKSALPPQTAAELNKVVTYLKAHPDSRAVISGYHDSSGSAALNAALSKRRAQAVQAALVAAGVPEVQTELRKPQNTTGSGDPAQARRVDVSVLNGQ
jgi:cytochrome c oxidase subunit 2